jgi:hypothetical protein
LGHFDEVGKLRLLAQNVMIASLDGRIGRALKFGTGLPWVRHNTEDYTELSFFRCAEAR